MKGMNWEKLLARWIAAGLVDEAAAERIRAFEARQQAGQGLGWPVLIAIALGGLLLASGVLLFVAAHWDNLSPAWRFTLVLLMVAVFHVSAAAVAGRFPALATTLHAVGTICLGAGVFLTAQIFNLQSHWPGGLLMWAIGAGIGWALLGEWPQAALLAVLGPAWLASEWGYFTDAANLPSRLILWHGLTLCSLTYLTARTPEREDTSIRRALMWIGGLTLIPLAPSLGSDAGWPVVRQYVGTGWLAVGWAVAFGLPIVLAWFLRRRAARMNLVAAAWAAVLAALTWLTAGSDHLAALMWRDFGRFLWLWLGWVGLIAWGLGEARRERVNLGVAGFAITTLMFYFSSVMDKLGRSASLIGLGVLFLVGGWMLERTRRRLVARLNARVP
jgi:uncharacterized membrane protein